MGKGPGITTWVWGVQKACLHRRGAHFWEHKLGETIFAGAKIRAGFKKRGPPKGVLPLRRQNYNEGGFNWGGERRNPLFKDEILFWAATRC